jgi:Ca2+-binding RTX toxin-like protein/subtilisin family serine protease
MTPAQQRRLRLHRRFRMELLEERALMTAAPHELRVRPEWFGVVNGAESVGRMEAVQPARGDFWNVQLDFARTNQLTKVADVEPLLGSAPFRYSLVRGLGEVGQIQLRTWADPAQVRDWLSSNDVVQSFSTDSVVSVERVPNDSFYATYQWGMENTGQFGGTVDADIDAEAAWDRTTGSSHTVVAIIDTGVDYTHPDLAPNMWVNPGEVAGDGIDNDANGFVDDIHGFDFFNNDADPYDDNYHGTHVAGTVGARGNNSIGVVGVNWDVKLMALKFLNSGGSGYTSDSVLATNYVTMMNERGTNVRVINASYGGGGYDSSVASSIARFGDAGGLFVAAAGNNGSNNDSTPFYPAAYGLPNLVSVAASTRTETLASFSNYGATTVDLAAPGLEIASTYPGNQYAYLNGTSMASPHVAGAAALAFTEFPDSTYAEIRQALRAGVDLKPAYSGKTITGGRLNLNSTLNYLAANAPATPSIYLGAALTYESLDLTSGGSNVTTLLNSSSGTATTALNLGANTFRFYGTNYTGAASLYVSENGLITFGSANSSATNNNLVSSPSQPTIAPFWDDLVLGSSTAGAVLSKLEDTNADGTADRLIVEWSNVTGTSGSSTTGTFQAILELNTGSSDGRITFNYPDLNFGVTAMNRGASATIGISNGSASGARELISFNNGTNALINSGAAIQLDRTRPVAQFATITPNSRLLPLSSVTLTFSEPIQESTFTPSDLSLTLNGSPVALSNDVTISSLGNNQYQISGLTMSTSYSGTFTLSVKNSAVRDLIGHYGDGTSSVTWNQVLPAAPVKLLSVSSTDGTTLSVTYEMLVANSGAFSLTALLSSDTIPDTGDTSLATVLIQAAADLTLGTHTVNFPIGTGSGRIPLPGSGVSESSTDYGILLTADSSYGLGGDPPDNAADLTLSFVGAYNPGAGIIYVHGSPTADTITIGGSLNISVGSTNYSYSTAGITQIRVRGRDGNDTINASAATLPIFVLGGSGNDTITGGSAADILDGGAGDNSLNGGDGNDTLISSVGNDALGGGNGNDTYVFDHDSPLGNDSITDVAGIDVIDLSSTTTTGVTLDLSLTTAQTTSANQTLTITAGTALRNIIGTPLADQLTGNAANNSLQGGLGDDTLSGGGGADTLDGGDGNDRYTFDTDVAQGSDTIVDISGIDTLDFSSTSTKTIECSLWATFTQLINSNLNLTLPSSTTIENLIGGQLNDTLWGNSLQNVIDGQAGNDTLRSSRGSDTLAGGAGDDTYLLSWDVAIDGISGNQGTITVTDTSGTDTLDFSSATTLAVTVNLAATTSQVVNSNLSLILSASGAIENVYGTPSDDFLSGNSLDNLLKGGAGNDTYRFNVGVAQGSDTIDESGGGTDTLDFSTTTSVPVAVDLGQTTTQVVHANLSLTLDSDSSIENLIGGSLADSLTGNSLANVITGGAGDDVLVGGTGNDSLSGGTGNDRYSFNTDTAQGTDTLDESSGGIDALDFSNSTTLAVTVNLGLATTQVINSNLSLILGSATTFESVWGSPLNDNLIGNANANTLLGNGGNDLLSGLAGNDVLNGGDGDDTYLFNTNSALGTDTLTDSSGVDLLDFSASTTLGVSVNLSVTTSQVVNTGLSLVLSSASAFENVNGTALNDVFVSNSANNVFRGGAGNDSYRFNTNTTQGTDTLEETGSGIDSVDFSTTTAAAVSVNLSINDAQAVNSNLVLILGTGTNFENLLGGALNDTLIGNSNANIISGNAGSDTIVGGVGNDTLIGGAGNDFYQFTADSALGTDTIDEAGGGVDTLDFSSTTTLAVTVNTGLATIQSVNSNLSLILGSASTIENITGTPLNDTLLGNSLANTILAGDGDDTLTGLGGADALNGGNGNDTYIFVTNSALGTDTLTDAAGTDLLDFSGSTTLGATVNLGITTTQVVNSNLSLIVTSATAFENIKGTSLNDTFTGNTLNNLFVGGAGNDSYRFNANTALGTDTIDESGGGIDTLDFTTTTSVAVSVNLNLDMVQVVHMNLALILGSGANFENLLGGSQSDTLIGNANANTITGNLGNDTITGGAGNDTLIGSGGNDIYLFDADSALGGDTINEAGGGLDLLDFSSTTTLPVTVHLGVTTVQTVNSNLSLTLTANNSMERVTGTPLADTLTGNSLANTILGGDGNDILAGLGGNDTLNGGGGNDTYLFNTTTALGTDTLSDSAGVDLLDFSASTTLGVTVSLGTATSQVVNSNLSLVLGSATAFENLTGTAFNDTITGNALSNVLRGGAGNDSYRYNTNTAQGSDTIDESEGGDDTLDFTTTTLVPVTVNLGLSGAQTVNANLTLNLGSDTSMERLIGGSLNDTLTGNANNNRIDGNAGNDTISGGAGDDILIGNAGNDTLSGNDGNDIYQFKADTALGSDTLNEATSGGNDLLDLSASTTAVTVDLASTTLQTVNANLKIMLSSNATFEMLVGSSGSDTLKGNAANNVIFGGAGNDTINGLDGADILVGGSGADMVTGGNGDDLIIGSLLTYYNETTRALNLASVLAVQAEWQRSDIGYPDRIANLVNGGGSNGSVTVHGTTATDDAAAIDSLFGNADLDWFWIYGSDSVADLHQGGTEVTNS